LIHTQRILNENWGFFFCIHLAVSKELSIFVRQLKTDRKMENTQNVQEQKIENGLTQEQKDKINNDGDFIVGVIRLAVGVFILVSLMKIVL